MVGDLVLSRDERTGEAAYRPVTRTLVTEADMIYHVSLDPDGEGPLPAEVISTTAEHPFWSADADRFIPASELAAGTELMLADGSTGVVARVEREASADGRPFATYNLSVGQFNTYFVGEAGAWVHNADVSVFCERAFSAFWSVRKRLRAGDIPGNIDPTDAAKSETFTALATAVDSRSALQPGWTKASAANLYAEAFDLLTENGEPGWLDYFEGRALPTAPGGVQRFGHTIDRHVGKTDAELVNRFNDPNQSVTAASSFADQATAEAATELFIEHHRIRLIQLAARRNYGQKTVLSPVDTGGPVGRSVGKQADGYQQTGVVQDVNKIQTVIVFDGKGGWSVLTSYPTL